MFVLFKYSNLGRVGYLFNHGTPLSWCEDESEIENMFFNYLKKSHDKSDYVEAKSPSNMSVRTSEYGRWSVEGYAVADLPNFNPNKDPDFMRVRAEQQNVVRRYDEFSIKRWREKSVDNERQLCELTEMVFRPDK